MTSLRSLWLAPFSAPLWLGLALAFTAPTGGCSSPSGDPADAGPEDVQGNITCKTDPRAEVYTANMEQVGTSNLVKFTLVKADPGPPLKGSANQWVMKVTDMNGQPLAAPEVTIAAIMPDHGHSWSTVPGVTKNPDGTVTFDRMNMFMHGIWEITFTATAGPVVDNAAYRFCID
jgi:hypothetical protein